MAAIGVRGSRKQRGWEGWRRLTATGLSRTGIASNSIRNHYKVRAGQGALRPPPRLTEEPFVYGTSFSWFLECSEEVGLGKERVRTSLRDDDRPQSIPAFKRPAHIRFDATRLQWAQ